MGEARRRKQYFSESDILECPDIYFLRITKQVNWGYDRSQGKRSGGTVKGGMGNAPRGIKTYTTVSFKKLPDFEKLKTELMMLSGHEAVRYLKARDFGLTHRESRLFALGMKYLKKYLIREE